MASTLLSATPEESDSAEARGAKIYNGGVSASGRLIRAQLQWGAPPAAATSVPCVKCHGHDGRGGDDAAVVAPPDITWSTLTDEGQHRHDQRQHGSFDEASLARAITEGIDPSGNTLDATMPRYTMAEQDLADLIAYLRQLETRLDPGLDGGGIRVGTVLPLDGPLAPVGKTMHRMLRASFARVNAAGGIHGRRLELVVAGYGATGDPVIWSARDLMAGNSVFGVVSGYLPGFEDDYLSLAEEFRTPLIGPHSILSSDSAWQGTYGFRLIPGMAGQTRALVRAAARASSTTELRLAIVLPLIEHFDRVAESARQQAERLGVDSAEIVSYALGEFDGPELARRLKNQESNSVLFLGSAEEFVGLARAAVGAGWHPQLLAPALLVERQVFSLPSNFDGAVMLSYPTLPSDYTQAGQLEFEQLHTDYGLNYNHSTAQMAAYTAARTLVEALERAGPDPSRRDLVAALEGLQGFQPGLTPPLSYGPGRRMGAMGAHVVTVNTKTSEFELGETWVSLEPGG